MRATLIGRLIQMGTGNSTGTGCCNNNSSSTSGINRIYIIFDMIICTTNKILSDWCIYSRAIRR